jgi:Zn-dependent M28 family amino/carboxypeptidase
MSATVKTLASDAFEGRAPGAPGEAKTVAYLVDRFRALGLRPGGDNGGWLQRVPLVHNIADAPTLLEVRVGGSTLPLLAGRDISPQTIRSISRVTIVDAPMVFVGYGVAAPERNWDDFKGDLFAKAGLEFEMLKRQARDASFRPVKVGDARLSIDMPVKTERVESRNVLAKLPGTTHPDETILFAAHWDAFGIGAPDSQGRTIRPGANDDALGIAGVLELARAFAHAPRMQRTLVFAAWTAEERGLLGSETFGVHPLYRPEKTIADMTIDILQTAGPARDVVLVGAGQSELEDDLARAAAAQGRRVTPDAKAERGLFYRADHFSLAKRGVPTLLLMGIGGGVDLVSGGRSAGDAWVSDYTTHCYHQTCDTWSPSWDLRGAAEDVDLFYRVGLELGNSRRWPEWRATSEFKAIRDTSTSARP